MTAAVLLVNATPLTTLTWGEMPYRLGRLTGTPFTVEDGIEGLVLESPLVFVSRWGAFAPDGEPAALAAIPARDRRYRAWTQRELLDRVAEMILGPDSGGAEALTRLVDSGIAEAARRGLPVLAAHAQPFDHADWTPVV